MEETEKYKDTSSEAIALMKHSLLKIAEKLTDMAINYNGDLKPSDQLTAINMVYAYTMEKPKDRVEVAANEEFRFIVEVDDGE